MSAYTCSRKPIQVSVRMVLRTKEAAKKDDSFHSVGSGLELNQVQMRSAYYSCIGQDADQSQIMHHSYKRVTHFTDLIDNAGHSCLIELMAKILEGKWRQSK